MRTVVVRTSNALACCDSVPPTVILCLASDSLLPPFPCGEEEGTYPQSTLEGTLVKGWKTHGECETRVYSYAIEYDETLLADPTVPLTTADISGVFCKDCKTTWIEEAIGTDVEVVKNSDFSYTLINEHGCEFDITFAAGSVCVTDTASVDLTVGVDGCVSADVALSADAGNVISIESDGLYAAAPAPCVEDSETIDFEVTGGGCVTGDVIISPSAVGNILDADADGLFAVPCVEITDSVNLFVDVDGCITAGVRISPAVPNILTSDVNGLIVAPTVLDTSTINFGVTGAGEVTGDVRISSGTGNQILAAADGLFSNAQGNPPLRYILGSDTVVLNDTVLTLDAQFANIVLTIPDPDVLFGASLTVSKLLFIKRIDASVNTVSLSGKIDGPLTSIPLAIGDGLILIARTNLWLIVANT